jgi:hypothetical protein
MHFGRGANVHVHLACASVRKLLLLEARQSCRDNLTKLRSEFHREVMGAVLAIIFAVKKKRRQAAALQRLLRRPKTFVWISVHSWLDQADVEEAE